MIRKNLRNFFSFVFFILLTSPGIAFGFVDSHFLSGAVGIPPSQDYQEFETQHFILVYPSAYSIEAIKAAHYLEEAHKRLSQTYEYEPAQKTSVILTDFYDSANGLTSTFGHQGLILFLTAPDPYLSIGEYDQWLKSLVIHEYTHFLTLDQRRGFYTIFNLLLGDFLYPNNAWPTWLAEGFAVYEESRLTMGGRGDGTFYNTLSRDAVFQEKKGKSPFRLLKNLSGSVPEFPFGEAQYYTGYAVIEQMVKEYGEKALAHFPRESSYRFPYFLNGTLDNVKSLTGHPNDPTEFSDLWNKWIEAEKKRQSPQIDWLEKNATTKIETFPNTEPGTIYSTRISPDGLKVAYVFSSGHELQKLVVMEFPFDDEKRKVIYEENALSGPGISFSQDGKKIFYSKKEFNNRYNFYSDLYMHNFISNKTYRLTKNERAKDPDFCRKNRIVYGTQRGNVSELRMVDVQKRTIEVLYRAPDDHHIATPRCTPSGESIYFTEHSWHRWDKAMVYSFATGKTDYVMGGPRSGFGALFLEPREEGLFFTKTINGFYLLSRYDYQNHKTTNLLASSGGIWMPSFSSRTGSRMVFTHLTSQGMLASYADIDLKNEISDPPALEPKPRDVDLDVSREEGKKSETATNKTSEIMTTEPHSYSFLSRQLPRVWSPYLISGTNHKRYGWTFVGWDDLDVMLYQAQLYYDNIPKTIEGFLNFKFRFGTFDTLFFVRKEIADYATFASGSSVYQEEFGIGGNISRPIPFDFWTFSPTLSFERIDTKVDGSFGLNRYAPEYRFGGSLIFDSRQTVTYSIAREIGSYFEITAKDFKTKYDNAWKGWIKADQYFRFFPRHSSFKFSALAASALHPKPEFSASSLKVGGQGNALDLNPPLRGYPLGNFELKSVLIGSGEYRVPVAQIFDGLWSLPVFFKNIGAFMFYDAAKIQRPGLSRFADSLGGGFLINSTLGYQFPAQIRIQLAHGFKTDLGAENAFLIDFSY